MKKRMFEQSKDCNGKTILKINNSSASVINECPHKAYLMFGEDLMSDSDSSVAQRFGTAVHKALEVFYSGGDKKLAYTLAYEVIADLPLTKEKHSKETLTKILNAYFEVYANDTFEILEKDGKKMTEVHFEELVFEDKDLKIYFHGTIDAIMRNKNTGAITIWDHKTTSALGTAFHQSYPVNHQITGYMWAASKFLGEPISCAVINGIQVAKTKTEFTRSIQNRTESQIKEWIEYIKMAAVASSMVDPCAPMTGGYTCGAWGGCRYLEICSTPPEQRQTAIDNYRQTMNQTKESEE